MIEATVGGVRFDAAAFSEQGPRQENQDAFLIERFAEAGLLALADGMGGERSGRRAADTALQGVAGSAPFRSLDAARRAVRQADERILRDASADPDAHGGMGCALGVLSLTANGDGLGWIAAHVGDVRILSLSPDGVLRLETRDHTPAFSRWEAGEISLDEIPDSAGANRLQRAVGRGGEADVAWLPAAAGWSWLIISDGVSKAMRLEELAAAMAAPTAEEGCDLLRRKVAERGPDDNYTAVLVRAIDDGRQAIAPHQAREMPRDPENRPVRSMGGIALGLSIAAFAVAAIAFWRAESAFSAQQAAELEQLRMEVDSMRLLIDRIRDPFQPLAPDPVDLQPPGANP